MTLSELYASSHMLTLLTAQTCQGCGYTSHDSHMGSLYVYHHLYLILFGKIISLLENNVVFVFEIKRIARSQRENTTVV